MKKKILTVVILLFVGFVSGWNMKPKPSVLTDSTITAAKQYCEKTIPTLSDATEKEVMTKALYHLNEGNINWSESLSEGPGINYRMILMFADMYDLQHSVRNLPKVSRISI